MKRQNILTFLLASFFIVMAFHGMDAYAQQGSISGDDVCGGSKVVIKDGKIVSGQCGIDSLKTISSGIFGLIISIGLPLLVVFIIFRFIMAWYALSQGNANAYKEAGKKVTEAIVGFIIIVVIAGGMTITMLKYLGVKEPFLKLLESISITEVVPRAYAAGSVCAPPNIGDQCFFSANGTRLVGNVTTSGSSFDLSKFCKDNITGLTSNTDFVNNTNYWREQADAPTDCTGKTSGTVCDLGSIYNHTMGVCSNSYTAPAQTGPQECIGKVDKTFCKARSDWNVLGSAGVCNLRSSIFTCDFASTGDKCFSPTTQKEGVITNINGFCLVVGDSCTLSNGGQGVYSRNGDCVAAATPSSESSGSKQSQSQSAAVKNKGLPNPLGFDSLYDFILGVLSMVMKFFLYPAMIGIWVYAGFLYVAAQGAPEKLSKAHKLLFWAVISTLIVFMTQGFLSAIKGSVNNILPSQAASATVSPAGTPDGRGQPVEGAAGSACVMDDETNGITGTDGICHPSGRR